jgi:CRP-like cAMP-binding protein
MNSEVAAAIAGFFAQYDTQTYPKGHILISPGDNPSHIYHLLAGRVKQYDISYRGDEVIVNIFKPPAFFPMSHAINGTPSSHFFQAEDELQVQAAPVTNTINFLKSHPQVMYDLLSRVYRGTDGLIGRIAHLMAGTARSRLLYELLIEGRRFGRQTATGTIIPANETDLSARAGLARETVSREIAKLKRENIITVGKDGIIITDLNRLAQTVSTEL